MVRFTSTYAISACHHSKGKVERDFTEFWYYVVNQLEKLKSAGSNDMPVKLQSLLKQGKNYQR
jgi:hypothetical protein